MIAISTPKMTKSAVRVQKTVPKTLLKSIASYHSASV